MTSGSDCGRWSARLPVQEPRSVVALAMGWRRKLVSQHRYRKTSRGADFQRGQHVVKSAILHRTLLGLSH
jgi:hypothetical protein